MKRNVVNEYKMEFEMDRESWKEFGVELTGGMPCLQSSLVRKALCGRWQEAYQEFLEVGNFSDYSQEMLVGFVLATEVTFHRRSPASIPELPKRVWSETDFQKALKWFEDLKFWNKWVGDKEMTGTTEYIVHRNGFAKLLRQNRPAEAEAYWLASGMDQFPTAESDLAAARMCAYVHGRTGEADQMAKSMWFYADSHKRSRGPISQLEIRRAFDEGKLLRTTYVWTEGMSAWHQAAQLACFQTTAYAGSFPPPLS